MEGKEEMSSDCVFCDIVNGKIKTSIVYEDELTMAFVDTRQFHAGHMLVIPKKHISDIRYIDDETGAALMSTLSRLTRAVDEAFPSDGISIWHSIGPGAFQEVPHLHIHIHSRKFGDGVLRVYPSSPTKPDRATLDSYAALIKEKLGRKP